MKILSTKIPYCLAILLVALSTLAVGQAEAAGIPWRKSLPAAISEAKRTGKPLFVNFSADWCEPCQTMKQKVFPNASVNAELRRWIPVYIDVDVQEALGEKYKITTMPALYVMRRNGSIVTKTVGYQNAGGLVKWLKANYAKAKR